MELSSQNHLWRKTEEKEEKQKGVEGGKKKEEEDVERNIARKELDEGKVGTGREKGSQSFPDTLRGYREVKKGVRERERKREREKLDHHPVICPVYAGTRSEGEKKKKKKIGKEEK